ncbi:MAG: ABC transporter permease [Erysipelotrichaceae bacterium]|nr:ABC transporter permease [Erysipelotrichaceae bacterium]
MNINIIAIIKAAILSGAPLLYGTSGEILTQKSGNMNLGVEGLMFMGGAFGLCGAFVYSNVAGANAIPLVAVIIAIICSFLAGVLGSLIFSFLTITLKANQNVTGLALTIFGTGVGQFVGELMRIGVGGNVSIPNNMKDVFANSPLPAFLRNIPVLGELLFSYNMFVYMGIIIVVIMWHFLNKTRKGLYLRAVGESPATADAAGINVEKYRYLATCIGGGISAMGGMVYIMTISGCVWNHTALSGEGWIAVALVIFCFWRPLNALWGSVLFGALSILYLKLPIPFLPTQIYKIVPYIATVLVLIFVSMKENREDQPPAGLGVNYFREDR